MNIKFNFESLSKFKSGVTFVEGRQHLGCPSTNKTNVKVDQVKAVLKTEYLLSMMVLTGRESYLYQSEHSEWQVT
jgi:hypothetical protein